METFRLLIQPDVQVSVQLPEQPEVRFKIKDDPMYRDRIKFANSEDDFSFSVGQTDFVFADMGLPAGALIKVFQYDKQSLTPDEYTLTSSGFILAFPADDVFINIGYL